MLRPTALTIFVVVCYCILRIKAECPFPASYCKCTSTNPPVENHFESVHCQFNGHHLPSFINGTVNGTSGYVIRNTLELRQFSGNITSGTFGVFQSVHTLIMDPNFAQVTWDYDAFEGFDVLQLVLVNMPNVFPLDMTISANLGRLEKLNVTWHSQHDVQRAQLNRETFVGLHGLTSLSLSGISLIIDNDAFLYIPLLNELRLDSAGLVAVPMDALEKLQHLRTLSLAKNALQLNDCVFSSLSGELRSLDLSSVDLSTTNLTHVLRGLQHTLQTLLLRNTKLTMIPNDFLLFMSKLNHLDVSECNITQVSGKSFPTENNLNYISLESNPLSSCEPGAFDNLRHVRNLILSKGKLTQFELNSINNITDLETLDLSYMHLHLWVTYIQQVPQGIKHLLLKHGNPTIDNLAWYMERNSNFTMDVTGSRVFCTNNVAWMAPYVLQSDRIIAKDATCSNVPETLKNYLQNISNTTSVSLE